VIPAVAAQPNTAGGTSFTGRKREDYVVARTHVHDGRTNLANYARSFVTENNWQRGGIELVADEQICMADAGGDYVDKDLIAGGCLQFDLLDKKWASRASHDRSSNTAVSSLY